MKADAFTAVSGENRGFTLIEVLISMVIFSVLMLSAVTIFRNSIYRFGRETSEKKLYSEAARTFAYLEKYLPSAMCSGVEGGMRIDFMGEGERVRFIAPFSEGPESDLARFGLYFDSPASAVKVAVERVGREKPDFSFPKGFSGAQVIGEGISAFALSYFDGSDWQGEWKTENMASPDLPRLIKIELTCFSGETEGERSERTFTKTVRIER